MAVPKSMHTRVEMIEINQAQRSSLLGSVMTKDVWYKISYLIVH